MKDYFKPLIPPSRAALKLAKGLGQFEIVLENKVCADFGANSGGFTAVMLNAGAQKVYAIETGYGVLDWKLRNDERVVMLERTNALFVVLDEKMDFISIDTSWTKQIKILNAAIKNLKQDGKIVTLVKPHYEATPKQIRKGLLLNEFLPEVLDSVEEDIKSLNLKIIDKIQSPVTGKSAKNIEWVYYLELNN